MEFDAAGSVVGEFAVEADAAVLLDRVSKEAIDFGDRDVGLEGEFGAENGFGVGEIGEFAFAADPIGRARRLSGLGFG